MSFDSPRSQSLPSFSYIDTTRRTIKDSFLHRGSIALLYPEVDQQYRKKRCGFLRHLWNTYPYPQLCIIALNSFNQGAMASVLMIIVNIYQQPEYNVSAFGCQMFVATVTLPTVFQFVYALFSETVPLFKSRSRNYLVLMGMIQSVACFCAAVTQPHYANGFTGWLLLIFFAISWIDALADGLLVMTATRIDQKHGAEDLQVFSRLCVAFGGIIPNIIAAILASATQQFQFAFLFPSLLGILIASSAYFLQERSEYLNQFMQMPFKKRFAFTIKTLKQAFTLKQLSQTLMFYTIFMLITPVYKDYIDYFYNFNIPQDASMEVIAFSCVFVASVVYAYFLEETEIKSLVLYSLCCYIFNSFCNILLFRSRTLGLSTFAFASIQTLIFDSAYQAFLFLPAYVTVSKLIPSDVESSIFAILKAIQALSQLVYGRVLGALIQAAIGQDNETTKLGATIAFGICIMSAFIMMLLLRLLPDKQAILDAQQCILIHESTKDIDFDRVAIDLSQIKELAQFKLHESFSHEASTENMAIFNSENVTMTDVVQQDSFHFDQNSI